MGARSSSGCCAWPTATAADRWRSCPISSSIWDDATHDVPVRVLGSSVVSTPDGLRLTGKHAYEGFLIAVGLPAAGDVIASHELHGLFTAS